MTNNTRSPLGGCLTAPFRWTGWGLWYLLCVVCACFSLSVIVSLPYLWRIPDLADDLRVHPFDIILRILDKHKNEPFYLLPGYEEVVERVRVPFPWGRVVSAQLGPHQWEHKVWQRSPQGGAEYLVGTVASPTRYTMIPPAELAASRQALDILYPPGDPLVRKQLVRFGETLLNQWWHKPRYRPNMGDSALYNSEDEALWFAWQRLHSGNPTLRDDLPRLGALLESAYPNPSDRAAALAWASGWFTRQDDYYRNKYEPIKEKPYVDPFGKLPATVFPPPNEASRAWLLYQFVGLNEASARIARERWLALFPKTRWDRVLSWGRDLDRERRAAGESLPPSGDSTSLLCVIERLTGSDEYGVRCRGAIYTILDDKILGIQLPQPMWRKTESTTYLRLTVGAFYPNDDLFFLLAGGDPLNLFPDLAGEFQRDLFAEPLAEEFPQLGGYLHGIIWAVVVAPPLLFGVRVIVLYFLGLILFSPKHERFREYRATQNPFHWRNLLFAYTLAPLALWLWYLFFDPLPSQVQVLVGHPLQLLAGVFASVILGGTGILCVNRIVALLLIRVGVNIHRTWLDEIIGALIGGYVLHHFGNSPASIAAFIAFAAIPESIRRLTMRRRSKEEQPSNIKRVERPAT